jgi:Bacterial TSP3 repeat
VKIFKVEGYKGNLFQFSACAIWALALAIMPHFNASAQNNDCILSREENVCLEFRSPDMFAAHYQLNPAYLDDAPDASVVVTWNGFGSYTQGFEVIEKTKYYKQCAPVSVIITNYFNWRPRDKLRFKLMGPEAMLSGLLFCNSGNIVTGINESVQLTNFTTSVPITKPGAYKLFEPLVYRMYCALASGCVETNLFISMLDIGPDTTNIYLGCGLSETILLQPNSAFSKPPYRWTDTSRPGFSTNTLNYQPYTFNPRGQCGTFVVTATMTNEPFATDSALIDVRKLEAETSVVYVARSCETNCGAELRIKSNCWSDDPLNWFSQPAGIEAAGTNAYIDPSYLDAGPYSVMVTSAAAPGCQGSIALHVLDVVLPADDLYIFTANPLYRRARLSVSSESYLADGSVTWSSIPAGISGTGRVISISTTNLSDGTYTVTARSTILSNCLATMTVLVGEDFPQVDDDGDTIPDAWEQIVGLDPHVNDGWWDHDFDGLPAIHEFHASTNPFDPDSDSDQMPDGWEVFWRLNPAENDAGLDADDDGSTNYREYREITNPRQFPGILQQVSVAGSFNDWSTQSHSLIRTSSHDWVGGATLLQGLNEFKFVGNLNWDSGFNWGCDASSITLTPPLSSINLVLSGGNVAVNIQTAGLYRVHFSTNALRFDLAKVNAISNPPVHTINRYRVAGTFNNWNTASEQSALYPMANELHAGVIYVADSTSPQWKIVENESWINNRGAYPSFVPASIVDAPTVPAGADFTTTSAAPGFLLTTYDPVSGRVYMKRIDHDTDLDGIPDQMEVAYYGSNPQNQDTDGDGLLDGVEAKDAKTQLTESDTDGDGLQDGWEIENNLDPLDNGILRADEVLPGSTFASSAHQAGSIHNGTNGDPDQDGLSNENEQMMGTSAANNDTDGDGMSDGEDYDPIKASCMIRVAMDQPVALPGIHQTASDGSGQRQNHTSVPFNFNLPPEAIGVTKVQVSGYVDDGFSVDGKDVENNKHAGGFNADITGFINNRKGPATITVFDYVDLGWEDNIMKFEGTAQIEYNVPVRVSGVPREVCVGNTISISVQVSPPEAAGEISFQSGNLAIASVSGSGSGISIQGLAAGVTSVKVLYGGDVCHTYSLNVRGTKIVGPGTMCVGAQDSFVASCGVAPFQWTSSNPQIASVNNGIVTAHQIGIVNISATDATGVRDTIKVKVGSGFEDETPLCVGDERALLAKCSGSTFSEWTSSSPAVASVSPNGILTALGPGVTEVRVRNGSGAYVSGMFQVVKFTGPEDVIAECWTDGGNFNSYAHVEFDDGHGYTEWDADEAEWSYEKVWGADPADFNVETGDLYFGDGGGRYKITAHHLDYGCEAVIGVLVARPTPLMIGEVEGVSCNADIKTATFYETTNANDDVWVNLNAGLSADNAPDCLRLEKSAGTLAFEKDGPYRGKVSRKQPGWVTIESECCHDDTCEHGKVVIVAGNLKIDSNNDKQITDEDDEVEMDNPGKIIMYNGNDDDLNNIPDREQAGCVTGEKDLVPVQIHIDNYNDLDDGTEIIIEAPQGATSIKLWADPQKCQPLPHPAVFKKGVTAPPPVIYVEGVEPGTICLNLQFKNLSGNTLLLDGLKLLVINSKILSVWESQNPVNIIVNNTKKDDPGNYSYLDGLGEIYGTPRNRIYVVESVSDKRVTLTIKFEKKPPSGIFLIEIESSVNPLAPKCIVKSADDPDAICLSFSLQGKQINTHFKIVAGIDGNNNQIIDKPAESIPLVFFVDKEKNVLPPEVKAFSQEDYDFAWWEIKKIAEIYKWFDVVGMYPHASALTRIFFNGNPNNVSESLKPNQVRSHVVHFNAFSGDFSEWLTHNSGGNFDTSGNANIWCYLWDHETSMSRLVSDSPPFSSLNNHEKVQREFDSRIMSIVEEIKREDVPIDSIRVVDSTLSMPLLLASLSEKSWVPDITASVGNPVGVNIPAIGLMPDDAFASFGRLRVNDDARLTYIIKKEAYSDTYYHPIVIRTYIRVEMAVEDLYDFNFETDSPANYAAIIQIGHGNGTRHGGNIYVAKYLIDRLYIVNETVSPPPISTP